VHISSHGRQQGQASVRIVLRIFKQSKNFFLEPKKKSEQLPNNFDSKSGRHNGDGRLYTSEQESTLQVSLFLASTSKLSKQQQLKTQTLRGNKKFFSSHLPYQDAMQVQAVWNSKHSVHKNSTKSNETPRKNDTFVKSIGGFASASTRHLHRSAFEEIRFRNSSTFLFLQTHQKRKPSKEQTANQQNDVIWDSLVSIGQPIYNSMQCNAENLNKQKNK
jgi:hypothetical protein